MMKFVRKSQYLGNDGKKAHYAGFALCIGLVVLLTRSYQ